MNKTFVCFVLLIKGAVGCHSTQSTGHDVHAASFDYDGEQTKLRKKREASKQPTSMEDFFVNCMKPYLWNSDLDVGTVVRFSVRETLWYENTDGIFCKNQDTTTCWSGTLYRYLKENSRLMTIAVSCIHEYGRTGGALYENMTEIPAEHNIRTRRQATGGLVLNEAAIESRLRQTLPRHSIGDIRTLIILAKEETICSPGICDCTGIRLPPGETCGQHWYTRIGALTRLNSPIRRAIGRIMNDAILEALRVKRRFSKMRKFRRPRKKSWLWYALLGKLLKGGGIS